ncbi:MAG: AMP-binding protein [Gammaproteobacteria bacterium]
MDKIWLKNYPQGVPEFLEEIPYNSIKDLFDDSCRRFANQTAYVHYKRSMTYAEFQKHVESFASFLQHDLGLKQGDRLAIMMPNCLQYPIALFAAFSIGVVIVNVNPLYTPREVINLLGDAKPQAIIVLDMFAHTLEKALPKINHLNGVVVTSLFDLFPAFKRITSQFVLKYFLKRVPTYTLKNAVSFRAVINSCQNKPKKPVAIHQDDMALIQYTGGTTGVPKGVVLSHGNLLANLFQCKSWIKPFMQEGQEVNVIALPLYHIFSLTVSCLFPVVIGAKNIIITDPRNISDFVDQIKNANVTMLIGVNTLFHALLHHKRFRAMNFDSLRVTIAGGMALQESVFNHWKALTGNVIIEGYGLSECSPVVTVNPLNIEHYHASIGLPLPSTEVAILNNDGQPLPIGEAGELAIKGPQVMSRYWHAEEETQKVFNDDGWLLTGDIAIINERGFIHLCDRKKDMILVSGFNVYPNEIENVLTMHPDIAEAAVIGELNKGSEVIKAFIVLEEGRQLTRGEVMTFCHENLTSYKMPKYIEFRAELPKTNVGKVLRRALHEANA